MLEFLEQITDMRCCHVCSRIFPGSPGNVAGRWGWAECRKLVFSLTLIYLKRRTSAREKLNASA